MSCCREIWLLPLARPGVWPDLHLLERAWLMRTPRTWICSSMRAGSRFLVQAVASRVRRHQVMSRLVLLGLQDEEGRLSGVLPELPSNARYEFRGNS